MSANIEHLRPAQIVAQRVREAREARGWTHAKLAVRLAELGYVKSRSTLWKLEDGRYRNVSVDDVFALAAAFGMNPRELLEPALGADVTVQMAPRVRLPADVVRFMLRGRMMPPMPPDTNWHELEEQELQVRLEEWFTRDMDAPTRDRILPKLAGIARQSLDLIQEVREEEERGN